MKLSKKDQLILEAMEAGFQNFEANALYRCLVRFKTKAQEQAAQAEREACADIVRSWINSLSHEPEMDEILEEILARGQE